MKAKACAINFIKYKSLKRDLSVEALDGGENMENKTFSIVTFAILIEAIITYTNEFLRAEKHLLLDVFQFDIRHSSGGGIQARFTGIL